MREIACCSVSILKWWYCTLVFSFFKFNMSRIDPSGFSLKKILEINCPCDGKVSSTIPLARSFAISTLILSSSVLENFMGGGREDWVACESKSMLSPPTQASIWGSVVSLHHAEKKFRNFPAVKFSGVFVSDNGKESWISYSLTGVLASGASACSPELLLHWPLPAPRPPRRWLLAPLAGLYGAFPLPLAWWPPPRCILPLPWPLEVPLPADV